MAEAMAASKGIYSEQKNVCVWNKTNGGMDAFYRFKHELVFVFKVGTAPHIHNQRNSAIWKEAIGRWSVLLPPAIWENVPSASGSIFPRADGTSYMA